MSAGSIFVPAGEPSFLQPERFSPKCQASSYLVNMRRNSKGSSRWNAQVGQSPAALREWPQNNSTAREGGQIANAVDQKGRKRRKPNMTPAPLRGLPALPTRAKADSCSCLHALLPPLFHVWVCLPSSLSFPLHKGFISGVYTHPVRVAYRCNEA